MDKVIIKTDKFGNKQWQNKENIGDTLNDIGNSIIEHNNSFYFVGTNRITNTNSDIIVGNIDNTGNVAWTKNIGGAGIQEGNNFIIDNENNIVVVGATNIARIPFGDTLSNDYTNIFALKTDIVGDSITSFSIDKNCRTYANRALLRVCLSKCSFTTM